MRSSGAPKLTGTPSEQLTAYFESYDRASFSIASCRGNEPSEADVAAFESVIGFRLPDDFRAFTRSPLGGLRMEVRQELWPRPKLYDVAPQWSFLYAIDVFGIGRGLPERRDLRKRYDLQRARDRVPFLQIDAAPDIVCFTPTGTIERWTSETGEYAPVRGGFAEVLMREIRDLEARLRRKLGANGK